MSAVGSSDVGWCCEQVVIEILSANVILSALRPTHADDDTDVTNNRIVAEAVHVYMEAPNQLVATKNVRRVEMRVSIRQAMGQMSAPDLYNAYGAMCRALEDTTGFAGPSLAYFTYLVITPALENEREREENRRKMTKTLNFLAILANPA